MKVLWTVMPTDDPASEEHTSCMVRPIDEHSVDIWHFDLNEAPWQSHLSVLSPEEKKRAHRFRFPRDARRFVNCRTTLRYALAHYLGCAAAEVQINRGQFGKPRLDTVAHPVPLHFNLSHCDDQALIAISRRQLGIDFEAEHNVGDLAPLIAQCFSPVESVAFEQLSHEVRVPSFCQVWTRKEAILKAVGCGLTIPLNELTVTFGPKAPAQFLESRNPCITASDWHLTAFLPSPTTHATLAVHVLPKDRVKVLFQTFQGSFT